ncbi:hypothetical protein OS493_031596 [Desmophyllum pertusum]|uniref:G-protein coupled receptors family 1 profile domain-containing protein n=1 Tax=Desmophyllum pertusum TaxID=174260 RepID=A0A9W9YL07_9CNID|nr:hypothetical protein OS493_031596 [Desmophyllum pertusum]
MLLVYFGQVAGLSIGAMVYDRYQAIYRKRFPSLSKKQISIFLCIIWILPIPFIVPMFRQEFTYVESAGVCTNAAYDLEEWNIVSIVKNIVVSGVGFFLVLFSFWKIFAFLLPLRRRVSPGLLSNEEKLTVAAHVHSAWTSVFFVLIYLILVTPIVIVRIINNRRINAGKGAITGDVLCPVLWLYWLQCAIKPIIYVVRSEKCMHRLCRCLRRSEMTNEVMPRCFSNRKLFRVYEVSEVCRLENARRSTMSGDRFPVPPRGDTEFLDLCRIHIEAVPHMTNVSRSVSEQDRTAEDSVRQHFQDHTVCCSENVVVQDSIAFNKDLESSIDDGEEDKNSYQDEVLINHDSCISEASPIDIPADVCSDALELEVIERMLDVVLKAQQSNASQQVRV